jgi:Patatin phospholipase
MTGENEIRSSSCTRAGTDQFRHIQKLRRAVAGLLEKLPEDLRNSPEAKLLGTVADRKVYNNRSADLSREGLRRSFQRLRVFTAQHGGTLARWLPRCRADTAPP